MYLSTFDFSVTSVTVAPLVTHEKSLSLSLILLLTAQGAPQPLLGRREDQFPVRRSKQRWPLPGRALNCRSPVDSRFVRWERQVWEAEGGRWGPGCGSLPPGEDCGREGERLIYDFNLFFNWYHLRYNTELLIWLFISLVNLYLLDNSIKKLGKCSNSKTIRE